MRILFFLPLFLVLSAISFAQSPSPVSPPSPSEFKEGQPLVLEGVEFIYSLGAEETKTMDGAQYSFFNLDCYITNKGKFSKIFLLEKEKIVQNPEFDLTKKAYLAKLHIINGLQFPSTSKFAVISAEPNMELMAFSKMIIGNRKKTLEGFNLQSGQTLTTSIVVAVPKGQRPIVSFQPFLSPLY